MEALLSIGISMRGFFMQKPHPPKARKVKKLLKGSSDIN